MIVESYEDVIVLSGALRSNLWSCVHIVISLTLARHPSGVIIDCTGLTEATEAGAETFRDILNFIKSHEARVILAGARENVLGVLRSVSEVRSQMAIADSVEEARRSLDLLSQEGKNVAHEDSYLSKLIVCITGDDVDRDAIELSLQISEAWTAQIHFVYTVLVPRHLPLTAPMANEEEKAASALERARSLVAKQNALFVHLKRGRDFTATIEGFADAIEASLLIVPLPAQHIDSEEQLATIRSLLTRLTQQLIFVRGQQAVPEPAARAQ